MLSIRIKSMLDGYKRKTSTTELFLQDLIKVDKFIVLLQEKKDFYKVRNKFCEINDLFTLECIKEYIETYYLDILDEDSKELYYLSYNEIKNLNEKISKER